MRGKCVRLWLILKHLQFMKRYHRFSFVVTIINDPFMPRLFLGSLSFPYDLACVVRPVCRVLPQYKLSQAKTVSSRWT
jgi:hypothetical protein